MTNMPKASHSSPQVFHLTGGGTHISVTSRGASWLSCELEMGREGQATRREILLGHQSPLMYGTQPGYLGAIVGRYANRIAGARFPGTQGEVHGLVSNEGTNQLHGGPDGFDKRDWNLLSHSRSKLVLGLVSEAGDQGFPGHLQAQVTYDIDVGGNVTIRFDTSVDAPCPVNLSSHAYFNLNGANEAGDMGDVLNHTLCMASQRYLPVDASLIPTGELAAVQATPFDFNQPQRIGAALNHSHPQLSLGGGGVDHCFVLDGACRDGAAPAARLTSADSRLAMTMFTSYPGLQCYTGNYLTGLPGRNDRPLARHAGLALEPEYFPDSPNHPEWPQPSCWQQAGEARSHFIRLVFERMPGAA
jgi:aldose 1-epimerase